MVGEWGETFINIGVIISVLGAYLAWTLLNAEVMYMPARTDVMPRVLARESANGTPIAALVTTNLSVQAFLLLVLVVDDALDFMLKLDTALTLVPYLLAAAYAAKLALTRETYAADEEPERRKQLLVATLAIVYSGLPAVRRRPGVPPARLPDLRPRHGAVRHRSPGAPGPGLPPGRGRRVRAALRCWRCSPSCCWREVTFDLL